MEVTDNAKPASPSEQRCLTPQLDEDAVSLAPMCRLPTWPKQAPPEISAVAPLRAQLDEDVKGLVGLLVRCAFGRPAEPGARIPGRCGRVEVCVREAAFNPLSPPSSAQPRDETIYVAFQQQVAFEVGRPFERVCLIRRGQAQSTRRDAGSRTSEKQVSLLWLQCPPCLTAAVVPAPAFSSALLQLPIVGSDHKWSIIAAVVNAVHGRGLSHRPTAPQPAGLLCRL